MVKVSVIVPVYNNEEYLDKCLSSLTEQSLDDIEIICVNDGSSDSSLDILNRYEQKDNRIVVLSQENQGALLMPMTGLKKMPLRNYMKMPSATIRM